MIRCVALREVDLALAVVDVEHRRPESLAANAHRAPGELAGDRPEPVLGRVTLVIRPKPEREQEPGGDREPFHARMFSAQDDRAENLRARLVALG